MACEIIWMPSAKQSIEKNLSYLKNNWTQKEVNNFLAKVEFYLDFIIKNPMAFAVSNKRKNIRSVLIVKQIRLYYKFYSKKNTIALLSFFDTRQKPSKLKLK